jgi:hypothetical protein
MKNMLSATLSIIWPLIFVRSLQSVPVQTNPIRWSLSLCAGAAVSAFGAGYFDDAADVPGQPVLHFGLRGAFRDGEVELVKVRCASCNNTLQMDRDLRHIYTHWLAAV